MDLLPIIWYTIFNDKKSKTEVMEVNLWDIYRLLKLQKNGTCLNVA